MGALVAAASKTGRSVSEPVTSMLNTLRHRGSEMFRIASAHRTCTKRTMEELQSKRIDSDLLTGQSSVRRTRSHIAQLPQGLEGIPALVGRFFPSIEENMSRLEFGKLENAESKAAYFIRRFDGAYVFALVRPGRAVIGRDTVGQCPLYYGETDEICAVASERKALWGIGVKETKPFPPGNFAVLDRKGFDFRIARIITPPRLQRLSMETAAQRLKGVLLQSTERCVSDVEEFAVAFSGGIDSSIIASLAKEYGANVHLVYTALKGQKETTFAERAARALNLPFHQRTYSVEDVQEVLPRVLWLVEDSNALNASIAVPMFWIAEQTAELGLHVLLAGQGGDELFGGYYRYLDDYAREGLTGLQKKLCDDTTSLHESNLQRDNKVCTFHGVDLRMPFSDWQVIQLALSIPADLKISSPKDPLRKRVLRSLGSKLGMPKFITEKPKKAIQYATGVSKALKSIAKSEGLTVRKYVEKVFQKTYEMLE